MTKRIDNSDALRAQLQRNTSDAEWDAALFAAADLKQLHGRPLNTSDIGRLQTKWGVSRATVWRRIKRFRKESDVTALLNRKRGLKPGSSLLYSEVDFTIRESARRLWKLSESVTVEDIAADVARECTARQLPAPSRATVGRRLKELRTDPSSFAGEVRKELKERRRLIKAKYIVGQPLEVVQLDHTLADVLLVDPQDHEVIGRPTLTLAMDIATRCVMGFCVSLEAPSCLLVALCLDFAVFPKESWLRKAGSAVQWPMHGLMKSVHTDNGREFHSRSFRRGCDLNRIDLIYRPPATPRFGGHIERLMGTFMRRTRLLPGNTYSDMLSRRLREAESKANLTLTDYRWFLTEEIERYHKGIHRTLGTSPMSAWERAWKRSRGEETPALPNRRDRFLFDFLPMRSRVVTREGIGIDGLRFSHPDLQSEVNPNTKRIVRIDPRDISRVYLEMAAGPYLSVPLQTDWRLAGMSWWEWRAIRRRMRGTAQAEPNAYRGVPRIAADTNLQTVQTPMRISRARARKAEWLAVQAIQTMPVPDTSLRPIVESHQDSDLPSWELLE